jgi:cob(I)alamin adenosyltransferase
MARPSGECEGQPCYTQGDIDEINAEITVCQAERTVLQQDLDAKDQQIMDLQNELATAQMNACPT